MQDSNSTPFDVSDNNNFISDPSSNSEYIKKKKTLKSGFDIVGNLPNEVLNFMRTDSYSLLIKGKPGTGKTALALTIMDNLSNEDNYFYISTRLSTKQLFYYYPWIKKFFSLEGKEFDYKFEDARLDEPESLFERITNQLMDVKSPIIIIDSWDTIASFMDRESRLNNERVLQIWRERAGAKLVFLSESEDFGILDSLVDGVLSLNYNFIQTQRLRKLILHKLRGINIKISQYYFSIYNGIFYSFDPISNLNVFRKIDYSSKKTLGFKSNKKNLNFSIRNQKKQTENTIDPFFNKDLVFLIFGKSFSYDLILSIIFKVLYLQLINNNIILTNNFNTEFQYLVKKLLFNFVPKEKYNHCILNNKIELSKILQNNDLSEHPFDYLNYLIEYKNSNTELRYDLTNKKILNLLYGNNLTSLLEKPRLLELLTKSFFRNIVILKEPVDLTNIISSSLSSRIECYRFFIKGSNIIVKSIYDDSVYYGIVSSQPDELLHKWFPFL